MVEHVPANGLVLGAVDKKQYKPGDQVDVILQQGDCLFLYTDGLSEIENDAGQQFDAEVLKQVVLQHGENPIDELVDHLIDEAQKFSTQKHKWDDITVIGIEKNE